jgi:hypothetical protein
MPSFETSNASQNTSSNTSQSNSSTTTSSTIPSIVPSTPTSIVTLEIHGQSFLIMEAGELSHAGLSILSVTVQVLRYDGTMGIVFFPISSSTPRSNIFLQRITRWRRLPIGTRYSLDDPFIYPPTEEAE